MEEITKEGDYQETEINTPQIKITHSRCLRWNNSSIKFTVFQFLQKNIFLL